MQRGQKKKINQNEISSSGGRQYPRVFLYLPIEYYTNNHPPRYGHTYNLSPGGVMLNVPERLKIGQGIKLAIFFALGVKLEAVKVNSQLVWVHETHSNGGYRSGVKFIDLSAADENKLQEFFEKF
jgi:c-di-GMP-binding flagellar brake protein YcgR